MTQNPGPFVHVTTLKAFGDFLIASKAVGNTLQRAPDTPISMIAGEHVRPLAEALQWPSHLIQFVGGPELKDVPAAFDIRKHGAPSAARSLLGLRRSVQAVSRPGGTLLFDRLGWRERFIAGGVAAAALPQGQPNIYLAYDAFFGAPPASGHGRRPAGQCGRRAFIVAASRIARKVLPAAVVAQTQAQLHAAGFDAHVLLLEGEEVALPQGANVQRVPRTFSALIQALRSADVVISADSLPAHVAEHLGLPTFVVSPTPNPYWLPRGAFLHHGHAVFDNLAPLPAWLDELPQPGAAAASPEP